VYIIIIIYIYIPYICAIYIHIYHIYYIFSKVYLFNNFFFDSFYLLHFDIDIYFIYITIFKLITEVSEHWVCDWPPLVESGGVGSALVAGGGGMEGSGGDV